MTQRYVTFSVQVDADKDAIRTEKFNNQDHLVVPVVALVEGVIQGMTAETPELALAEEFGKYPQGWNGRPVTMGHPLINGSPVSANSPGVLEDNAFGVLFNTTLDGDKLKTEAWIGLDDLEEKSEEVQEIVEILQNASEPIEVSTGLFATIESKDGRFNGEKFNGVWTDVVPDHLAILSPGTKGACSVEDGCGAPRLNAGSSCSCGGTCESCSRASSPEGDSSPSSNQDEVDPSGSFLEKLAGKSARALQSMLNIFGTQSDMDVRRALDAALAVENPDTFTAVIAVFEGDFVYERGFGKLLRRSYEIQSDETVQLGSELTEVRPVTDFVEVKLGEEDDMNVNELISNASTPWTEDDREFLEGLSEEQLDKINKQITIESDGTSGEDSDGAAGSAVTDDSGESDDGGQTATPAPATHASTAEEYIAQAPGELQEVLQSGLKMQRERKHELVKGLLDNSRNAFTKDELEAMSLDNLERLSALADVPTYEGAAPIVRSNAGDDEAVPAPAQVFPLKAREAS